MPSQVVDTGTAREFMSEVLERVSEQGLAEIAHACDAKSQGMQALLADGRAAAANHDDLRRVLRSVFSTRRRADAMLDAIGPARLANEIDDLLHGPDSIDRRVETFDEVLTEFPDAGFDLPGELLHFTYPEQWWPWTRWMWDPRIDTGALRLVTMDEVSLTGSSRGETYRRVGEAIAFVQETGHAVGFTGFAEHASATTAFDIDVFLAAVYGVYMYTVLRMRMTQEFNKIVPELPNLVRRLLGVYRPEV